MAGVVGADHNDGDFCLLLVAKISVVEAPNDVLGAVAADAKVEGVTFAVVFVPSVFAGAFPALGDGVTDEEEVVLFILRLGAHRAVTL